MKSIIRTLTLEKTIIVFVSAVILLLSTVPFLVRMSNAPPGRDFLPIHNSLSDYPLYTSIIKQGTEGVFPILGRFTTEDQKGSIVHLSYWAAGRLVSFFGISDAHLIYHFFRYGTALFYLSVLYWFIRLLLTNKIERIIGFFLCLFSAGFPVFVEFGGQRYLWWNMTWWSELDPIARTAFLPHYMIGHALMLICFGLLIKYNMSKRNKFIVLMAALGFAAGFIHPPSLIIVIIASPLWLLLQKQFKSLVKLLPILILSAVSFLVVRQATSIFPWSLGSSFEKLSFALSIREYLFTLGPIVPLGMAGFIIERRNKKLWLLFLWVLVSIIMVDRIRFLAVNKYWTIRQIAIANTRFLQVSLWIPLSIASAKAFSYLYKRFGKTTLIFSLVILVIITFAGYPAALSIESRKVYGHQAEFAYPESGVLDAISALCDITPESAAVLAMPLVGQMIPAFINRTVYTGSQLYQTKDLGLKMDNAYEFYKGSITKCQAYNLLKQNNIMSVYYGYDEQNIGKGVYYYSFLQPWQRYGNTEIFKFVDIKPAGCDWDKGIQNLKR